jgi:hypothetical protein
MAGHVVGAVNNWEHLQEVLIGSLSPTIRYTYFHHGRPALSLGLAVPVLWVCYLGNHF